jgi:acyl carrier protein
MPDAMTNVIENAAVDDSVLKTLYAVILALAGKGSNADTLQPDSRLIEDLGLDSFKIVELTVRIEDAFGLAEFDMQAWVDERVESGEALTVGSLARACQITHSERAPV